VKRFVIVFAICVPGFQNGIRCTGERTGRIGASSINFEQRKVVMNRKLVLVLALGSVLAAPAMSVYAEGDEEKKSDSQLILSEGDEEKKSDSQLILTEGDVEKKSDSQLILSEGDEEKKSDSQLISEGDEEKKSDSQYAV
jgi:hypothetical protein